MDKLDIKEERIMNNKEQIIKELAQDETFLQNLVKAESVEEIDALFKGKDVELSKQELEAIYEELHNDNGRELSDDELDGVAGGISLKEAGDIAKNVGDFLLHLVMDRFL